MKAKQGSLTDIAASIMVNKSEQEIQKIRQEGIVRRTGTLEDQISSMWAPKPAEPKTEEKPE